MTTASSDSRNQTQTKALNRLLYGGFVLLGLYYLATGELTNALANLGIALIADPFDASVTWKLRPTWQRAWLVVHLLAVLTILVFTLIR